MKRLVIAATSLALALPAVAQTTTTTEAPAPAEQAAENAAATAEAEAKNAEAAAEAAVDKVGAEAEKAVDEAESAADSAADAAAKAADDAAAAAANATENAAENAEAAADNAEAAASDAADSAADAVEQAPVTPPDVNAPAISEADPGLLSSWITSRRIWTTNQPSSTAWTEPQLDERPAEWQDIAKVNDIVLNDSGEVVGYVADIGGFLGIGEASHAFGAEVLQQRLFIREVMIRSLVAHPSSAGQFPHADGHRRCLMKHVETGGPEGCQKTAVVIGLFR